LEIEGRFQVDTALSVEEAMEKMKKERHDAVVSDYVMLGKDGFDFLKELRDAGNSIPFIIFTGKGREEIAIKALNLGADGYFSKIGNSETVYGELAHGIRQIVNSKKTEEMLRINGSYLKEILDSMLVGLVVIDEETHRIADANSHALKMIGSSREDVIGKICHRFICPSEKGKCPITDLGQTVERSEHLLLRADSSKVSILKTVTTITWRGRKYIIESFIDITERNKAEKAIEKSEKDFRTLMEEAPIGVCNTDLKGKITYVNKRFEQSTGYSRKEIVGKNGFELGIIADETLKLFTKRMKERLMGKPSRLLEGQFKRKDGEWIWAEVEGRLIKKFGVPVGFQLITRDITERKRAEEQRKRFEDRLSALHTHSRALNMAESREEICRLTLDAMEKTLGFEIAFFMIVDKGMLQIVDNRGYPEAFSIKLPLDGTKKGVSVKVARTGRSINVPDAEKNEDWVEFMPGIRSGLDVPVKIGSKVLGVIGVDSKKLNAFNEKDQELLEILASHAATAISNLDRAENLEAYAREIRESQQRFERLFMDNPEAAVHLDSSFHILNINPRFIRLFGYSLDEIKGKHINDVIVPKEKMEEAVVFDERASKGELYHEDTVRKRKDGSLVPVAFSCAPIIAKNQVTAHIAVYKDISQLKKAEEELRETLEKLGKMNEKLRVIGGLTRHDARNKLSAIIGNVYLAKKRLTDNREVMNNLKEMEAATAQMVRIFDFAKTYEMLEVEELRFIDVEKMVNEAVSLFSDLKGIKVINNCHGLTVLADSLLRQLFYNLVDNSLKYGEKIKTIHLHCEELDKDKLKLVYGSGIPRTQTLATNPDAGGGTPTQLYR
jgi:PAS domain S-box-containing protein